MALQVEGDGAFEVFCRIRRRQQFRENIAERRSDASTQIVARRERGAEALQGVSNAVGDSGSRIDQRAVQIEENIAEPAHGWLPAPAPPLTRASISGRRK